jgi:asparagine synthase (glutamine-hydrolysing)
MCGILGAISPQNNTNNFQLAFDVMRHRGPDKTGIVQHENVILGTHRLKIQDLSSLGDQPMTEPQNRYTIIFNGEIYNHFDIRKKLKLYGVQFVGNSDTETVLLGYIQFGQSIVNMLNGIFAFAIYDKLEHKLFAARDQMGVKPFYIFQKDHHFAFSSEIKSLIYLDYFDKTINHKALVNYLHFLWSPGEITPFQYVNKLLPGECFTIDTQNVSTFKKWKYFDIPFNGSREIYHPKMWLETVDEQIKKSVQSQLLSDVPVGFFLSGGIDSSVLVAEARRNGINDEINCFTIKGGDDEESEGFKADYKYAKEAANKLGVKLHAVDGSINIVNAFDKMIWHLDEPQADFAPLYVYSVCEAAREMGIKVMISGAGGDDVFSGYRRHQAISLDNVVKNIPSFVFHGMAKYLKLKDVNKPTIRRLNKFIKRNNNSSLSRLIGYFEWFPICDNLDLFHPDIQSDVINYNPEIFMSQLLENVSDESNLLNKMLYLDQKTFLVDHNLNYTDKMGMAAGVEVRVPYLDLDLIKMGTKLPPSLKLHNLETKHILRKIAAKHLPSSIVNRSKTGFGAPVRKWINDDLANMINERLSFSEINKYQIFNFDAVQQLIADNKKGKVDGSYTILTLMAVQSWMDQFYQNDEQHN